GPRMNLSPYLHLVGRDKLLYEAIQGLPVRAIFRTARSGIPQVRWRRNKGSGKTALAQADNPKINGHPAIGRSFDPIGPLQGQGDDAAFGPAIFGNEVKAAQADIDHLAGAWVVRRPVK